MPDGSPLSAHLAALRVQREMNEPRYFRENFYDLPVPHPTEAQQLERETLLSQIAEGLGIPRVFLEPGLSADAVRYQPPEGHATPEEDMDAWFAELNALLEEEL